MAIVRYLWHGFIHRVQHLCTFNIVPLPLISHLLPNVWKASYTISTSIFVDVLYWLPYCTDKFISSVVPGSSKLFFLNGKEIIIAWTYIGWVQWMFQNFPLPAAQEVCDSSSVTPFIVMKNDGVLYHQASSFSPEHWMKVFLPECAVVGSVYHLPWRHNVMQCYPHQCHMPEWTSPTQHIV